MFVLDCPTCGTRSLLDTGSLVSLANGADGPVGVVRCPVGHEVVHFFRERRPRLATPAATEEERPGAAHSRRRPVTRYCIRGGRRPHRSGPGRSSRSRRGGGIGPAAYGWARILEVLWRSVLGLR